VKDKIFLANMIVNSELNIATATERKIFRKKNAILKKSILFIENNFFKILSLSFMAIVGKEIVRLSLLALQDYIS